MTALAAAVTDKLIEVKPRWSGQIGSGGVADGTVQTIPLQSASNLDNGDVYIFTINRVNANGVKQDTWETAIGELSSTNFINCVRRVEGNATESTQWVAGTVVEILFTAKHWNNMIDFLGVEHDADGTHDATKIVKMTGNQTIAGVKTFSSSPIVPTPTTDMQAATKLYVDPTVTTITSSATPTPTGDKKRNELYITALAAAAEFQLPSGTLANGNIIIIRVKDDGTARALTYVSAYRAIGVTLPTTTVLGKTLYLAGQYNSADSKVDILAVGQEA